MTKVFLTISNWLYYNEVKPVSKYDKLNWQHSGPRADAKPLDFTMHQS